jgi:hypothetical protein
MVFYARWCDMSYITLNTRMAQILLFGPAGMASKQSGSEPNRDGLGDYEMARDKDGTENQKRADGNHSDSLGGTRPGDAESDGCGF